MKYRNFDIELYEYEKKNDRESFSVRLTNSPAGDQSPSQAKRMTLPRGLRDKPTPFLHLEKAELAEVAEYGEALADCLLPPMVRQRLWESVRWLKEDEALRLRLKFDAWQLADLAWEYLYMARSTAKGVEREIDGFLALDRRFSIVRYAYVDYPLVPFLPQEDTTLRELVLLSNPKDLGQLNLEKELECINESLRSVTNLAIEVLNNPTVEDVQEALSRTTHIFHFAGPGGFLERPGEGPLATRNGTPPKSWQTGKGIIVLCTADGKAYQFPAEKLALNLAQCGVRIAFINSCDSAVIDPSQRLSGLAPALVQAGIPAVIGLNGTILDNDAIAFSKQFYRTLAAGRPVDTAVTNGRLAIFNETQGDTNWSSGIWSWGIPVLYLRTRDCTIFPIRPNPQKTMERRLPGIDSLSLRNRLTEQFSVDELKLLCVDITEALNRDGISQRVDLEIVGGTTKETNVLNLMQYLERRGLLDYLKEAAVKVRPHLLQTGKDIKNTPAEPGPVEDQDGRV